MNRIKGINRYNRTLVFNLDETNQIPLYSQLRDNLRNRILSGKIKPKTRLPSEEQLSKLYDVGKITIRMALGELVREGLIYQRRKRGTFVAPLFDKKLSKNITKNFNPTGMFHFQKNIKLFFYKSQGILISDPFFSKILEGVEEESNRAGYNLSIGSINIEKENIQGFTNKLNRDNIQGIMLLGNFDDNFLYKLRGKIPFVLIDYHPKKNNLPCVISNNFKGAYDAVKCLIKSGHRRIGFITHYEDFPSFTERLEGYKKALKNAGIKYKKEYVQKVNAWKDGGYRGMKKLLKASLKPTGTLCTTTILSAYAMKAAKEKKEDISIVAIGDSAMSVHSDSFFGIVRLFQKKMGKLAVKKIIGLVKKKKVHLKTIVPTKLIIRDTT